MLSHLLFPKALVAIVALLLMIGSAVADEAPTVTAQGVAVKQVAPSHVRVRFRVFATGKTAHSAMSKLDADRKALETRVSAIKDDKPEFRMGEVIQHPEVSQPFPQRMMAVAMAGGQKKHEIEEKRTQRLAFEASLVWPSKTASNDRLCQLDEIEEQLRHLELIDRGKVESDEDDEEDAGGDRKGGKKNDGKVERKSQMQLDARPTYDFIYQGDDAEFAELRKAAFADARKRAEEIAVAAGRKLGALRSLSCYGGLPESMFSRMNRYQSNMDDMFGEGKPRFMDDFPPDPRRTTSELLQPMEIRSEVHAVFSLD